ncbi:hypothetical protein CONLIGDRAFT_84710 [Coniochaeta ligniaria NRRL 30616]|uniref:Uncharacterized protein n=1 Tax=Coniochaeta ligniaria NRRL 30616 TaxID=1408157 RepID=A0A1J7ID31_9PEZI|nr:hypothetical protein CONLIGDRAFT_84710 [Coniochaeta ligniaria NRRL 30616]
MPIGQHAIRTTPHTLIYISFSVVGERYKPRINIRSLNLLLGIFLARWHTTSQKLNCIQDSTYRDDFGATRNVDILQSLCRLHRTVVRRRTGPVPQTSGLDQLTTCIRPTLWPRYRVRPSSFSLRLPGDALMICCELAWHAAQPFNGEAQCRSLQPDI